jgi:hypothetical protein
MLESVLFPVLIIYVYYLIFPICYTTQSHAITAIYRSVIQVYIDDTKSKPTSDLNF